MLVPSTNLINFQRGLKAAFFEGFNAAPDMGHKQLLMTVNGAVGKSVIYGWLGALPGMKQLKDEAKWENLRTSDWTILNLDWEDSVLVDPNDIADDQLGVYSGFARAMGDAAACHPVELTADLLLNGFTNTDYTGSAFFATGKTAWDGATAFSNKVTKKLSRANYRIARKNMLSRVNAKNRPLRLGRRLVLVVAPHNEQLAKEILKDERDSNGKTNTDRNEAEILVLPDLAAGPSANEEAWFLIETGYAMKPFFEQVATPLTMYADTSTDSRAYMNDHKFAYQFYKRGNIGYGLPELAYGSDGTTAA